MAEEAARWSGEERQRRGKESRFPYLSTDRRDIVDLAIEAKSDFPSPALESSRRRFSSFAHGSLPTPLPLRLVRSRNSSATIFDLTKVGCSLSIAIKGLITRES